MSFAGKGFLLWSCCASHCHVHAVDYCLIVSTCPHRPSHPQSFPFLFVPGLPFPQTRLFWSSACHANQIRQLPNHSNLPQVAPSLLSYYTFLPTFFLSFVFLSSKLVFVFISGTVLHTSQLTLSLARFQYNSSLVLRVETRPRTYEITRDRFAI